MDAGLLGNLGAGHVSAVVRLEILDGASEPDVAPARRVEAAPAYQRAEELEQQALHEERVPGLGHS
jgi:hypothetical protein